VETVGVISILSFEEDESGRGASALFKLISSTLDETARTLPDSLNPPENWLAGTNSGKGDDDGEDERDTVDAGSLLVSQLEVLQALMSQQDVAFLDERMP